ncbi:hypothetical protein [Microbispora amethystogenes]|uniref:Integral membrane protein n=1 Tax=Microbispora amethystogenes TaxID=1427754 RepID=A0ABQ4FDF1_9ACTN|nr:hypothetical protein [Microbispora amethystogenes]GIH32864.1 hypothetical protein Mam01_30280 [Microbispora amethystogenes]
MGIAALVTWLLTAVGGFVMLGVWIARGGRRTSRFSPGLIFGHFALAAAGLVVWIVYLVAGVAALAWVALVLLVPVALLGFAMFARWIPAYRSREAVAGGPGATGAAGPPERHFPVVIVAGHGLLAVATVALVLLTALGVSGG